MPPDEVKQQAALRTADAAISLSLSRDEWDCVTTGLYYLAVKPGHHTVELERLAKAVLDKIKHHIAVHELPSRKTPSEES